MPHIHKDIDFTSEVFIVYKNKVLLRKHDKFKEWLSVGGHIELTEDPNEAAIREVREEVGLEITLDDSQKPQRGEDNTTDLIPPYFLNRHKIDNIHSHVTFVYFAVSNTDQISETIEREKSEDCRWFTREELVANNEIKASVKFYALKALKKLSKPL